MEPKNEFELAISQGRRHIAALVLAAFLYAFILFRILMFIYTDIFDSAWKAIFSNFFELLRDSAFVFSMALSFSVVKDVFLDIDTHKLISRYSVGPFYLDREKEVPDLDYVSVFRESKYKFKVNLWYGTNRHYTLYIFEKSEPAFKLASYVAEKLSLDVLDATKAGDFKWIEKM